MKYLCIGIILSVIGVILSMSIWGFDKAYIITGVIGIFFVGISTLMSGAIVGPHRLRANLATESEEDRQKRNKTTLRSGLIGLPNIVTTILLYYFI